MNCRNCGQLNSHGAAYCQNCGAPLVQPRNAGCPEIALGVILIGIFSPVGLCGVLLVTHSVPGGPETREQLLWGIVMVAVAALSLYFAGRLFTK